MSASTGRSPFARAGRRLLGALSIRQRLALWYALLLCVTLMVFSFGIYAVAANQLLGAVHTDIEGRAGAIARALVRAQDTAGDSSPLATPSAPAAPAPTTTPTAAPTPSAAATAVVTASPAAATPSSTATPVPTPNAATSAAIEQQLTLTVPQVLGRLDLGFEVLDAQGHPQYYAPSLNGVSLPLDEGAIERVLHGGPSTAYTVGANSSTLEIFVQPIVLNAAARVAPSPADGGPDATSSGTPAPSAGTSIVGAVLVARPLDDVSGALSTLRRLLLGGDLAALAVALFVGWLIARAGLSPLTAVTGTARAIANRPETVDLGTRVRYSGPRDEVGTLANTFNEMLAAIQRVTMAQHRFVADASHELRAPITTIKGTLEFVLRRARADVSLEERMAMLEDAYAEAERMASLVNQLLLLARADAASSGAYGLREAWLDEQIRGRREPVELDRVAMDVFHHAQLQARQKDLRLRVTGLEPATVLGDPAHIRQIALILVDNAIKYTPAGGQVDIAVGRRGQRVAFSVADTGIGIAPEALPNIFERFYRSDQAREREEHGSGLGLAIAKWMVDSHGGAIRVSTTPGQGSTFTVLLPESRSDGDLPAGTQADAAPADRHPVRGEGTRRAVAVRRPVRRTPRARVRPHA
jgi:signal transduction histidine kinase